MAAATVTLAVSAMASGRPRQASACASEPSSSFVSGSGGEYAPPVAVRPSQAGREEGSVIAIIAASCDRRMPPIASLALVLYSTLVASVNMVIIVPDADDYANQLGGDQLFSGLMIGAVPLMAAIGTVANQWLLRSVSFKTVLLFLSSGTVLGNALYALAGLMHFKWTLLAARCLIGLCNGFNLPPLYISLTVGLRRRSEAILYYSAMSMLGCALGPALTAVLDIGFKCMNISTLVMDANTAPGWFMAVVYALFMAKVVFLFEDLPLEAAHPKVAQPSRTENSSGDSLSPVACCAALWYVCVAVLVVAAIEVYSVDVAQHYWGWSMADSAWFVAGLMLTSGLSNLAMGRLTQSFVRSDRAALFVSSLFGCLSCGLLFNFELDAVSAEAAVLGVGLFLLLVLSGLIRAFGLAASSKLAPAHMKASMNMWAMIFMTLGRGVGSIVGAVLQPDSFFPVAASLFGVTSLVSVASHARMKPRCEKSVG